jgi:hypothetical protein
MKYLLDSNIIIYHLNGNIEATRFLENTIKECSISRITFIEVLSFDYSSSEEKSVLHLLENMSILDTSREIGLQAIQNRKNKSIKVPDNIIASTAQVHKLILVTRNLADFQNIDVQLLDIFDDI